MAKGIVAFLVTVFLILSVSILGASGFYASMNVDYSDSGAADVENAKDALVGQSAADKSSGGVLTDFTTSAGRTLSVGWQIIANLSGILKMLFLLPGYIADPIQVVFQIWFSVTFAAFIRGVILQ